MNKFTAYLIVRYIGEWAHAGKLWKIEQGGQWLATLPFDEWKSEDVEEFFKSGLKWDQTWGDRRQEIVIIGVHMDKENIREEIESCLLRNEEMNPGSEIMF